MLPVVGIAIVAAAVTAAVFASTPAASGADRPLKQTTTRLVAFEP